MCVCMCKYVCICLLCSCIYVCVLAHIYVCVYAFVHVCMWVYMNVYVCTSLFSCSVASDSLWPRRLYHARLPCPSLSPGVCSDSCPLSRWCHPTISSSVTPFSFCLQSFPASGSFLMCQLFASGGQSIGASASTSALPMNIQDSFPVGWTGWISLLILRVFSSTIIQKHQFFRTQQF